MKHALKWFLWVHSAAVDSYNWYFTQQTSSSRSTDGVLTISSF